MNKQVEVVLEAMRLLNEAQGKIVSVGMNPDFDDMRYGDSPWIPDTQESASKLISQASKLLGDFPVDDNAL